MDLLHTRCPENRPLGGLTPLYLWRARCLARIERSSLSDAMESETLAGCPIGRSTQIIGSSVRQRRPRSISPWEDITTTAFTVLLFLDAVNQEPRKKPREVY